jgi:protein TonB
LVGLLFLAYKTFYSSKTEEKEKCISLKLHCLVTHTPLKKRVLKEQEPPKKVLKKITPPPTLVKKEIPKTKAKKREDKRKKIPLVEKVIPPKVKEQIAPLEKVDIKIEKPEEKKKIEEKIVEDERKSVVCKKVKREEKAKKKPLSNEKVYMNENLKKIVALLQENLYYPRRARKRGVQGSVKVRFTLLVDGTIASVKVISSKSDILSRGALRTIENLSGEFPKPKESLTLTLPISYSLR